MKRTIASLLACMLLIPGILIYASAGNNSIFTYDDSKAYVPNVILMEFKYSLDGIHPDNGWGSDAFGDVNPLIQNFKSVESYETEENGKRFRYDIYQITLVKMYQHDDLINLATHLADVVMSVEPVNFPECRPPRSISLVEKPVVVEEYYDNMITEDNGALGLWIDNDYVARDYPWSVKDFPELDIKSIQVQRRGLVGIRVNLKLNDSSKEALINAAQKLAKRYEFTRISFFAWSEYIPEDSVPPVDTTVPDETTVPVTETMDTQTTEPAAETTVTPEKPTSPPTGDAGIYAACVLAAAAIGVVGVVVYRRRRAV